MSDFMPDDYIKYRLQRANETISETKILIENKLWNTAIKLLWRGALQRVPVRTVSEAGFPGIS